MRHAGVSSSFDRKESIEKVILRTARKNGGYVTPGEVALEGDVSVDQARETLEKLASKGYAQMRVRTSGVIVYAFPEFFQEGKTEFEDGI
jgi:predicted ArsR family transcriptional regulator